MTPLPDPAGAPAREDLPFLRRRSPRRAPAADPKAADSVAAFISGRAGHGTHHRDEPVGGSGLDLSAPSAPASAPARLASPPGPGAAGPGLDLSRPATPAEPRSERVAPAPGSSSLDLSAPSAPARPTPPPARRRASRPRPRIGGGAQRILDIRDPTVWLTRVQSGIGELRVEAVCGDSVGDLRLGALYQFRSGTTSTAQYTGGNRYAPSSRRPVIVCGRDDYEYVNLDLRQTPEIERIAVYAYSESRAQLSWGGTLVATTVAGGRIELPLETLHPGSIAVLISVYNVDSELVVRAEMETISGDVREAARAYGYDRITWRDAHSPAD